jgi:hypothetical protein
LLDLVQGIDNESTTDCPALSRYIILKPSVKNYKEPIKKVSKLTMAPALQTQTRHSTTQTPSVTHNQGHLHRHHHQGRCKYNIVNRQFYKI